MDDECYNINGRTVSDRERNILTDVYIIKARDMCDKWP